MTAGTRLLRAIPPEFRERMLTLAREVSFPQDARVFEERGNADRFWVIRSGAVTLDLRLSESRSVTVETLGPGDLLGWSWMFPPYEWDFGAEALSPVRAYEFDGAEIREECDHDPRLGYALIRAVAEVLAQRLHAARSRLIDS
ncbi:cyclic nucleotide-binding domain-containing protein [Streptomyces sp. SL13]|jgi:CRP-like cAMP-binding protein|uniref:Cyclic nucleotide-binding domain-containing protein n=1 Tax=Streptantibioticus silvisoli TaxID=2705255 RepID=A0AA90KCD1_9ACTN|nr:cyclic nucleotide-binding domain-containing protein [Streptantibioticus silvisoli]MDI5961800.1 cyclic nucleotide-binding domain-containing protein [Streptantibioticus silvisoli]MDI5974337.1 cyclic nucleotide-binding domain-containing protein [Streptantibioticus silvisoli]